MGTNDATTNKVIVVGVDDSDGARAALRWGIDQAAATSSSLTIIQAFEPRVAWIDVGSKEVPKMVENARSHALDTAQALVDEVVATTETAVSFTVLAIAGQPAEVLLQAARDANLLVVGSRGRGGFKGVLLGSVSQRVAELATCPVVIIRA